MGKKEGKRKGNNRKSGFLSKVNVLLESLSNFVRAAGVLADVAEAEFSLKQLAAPTALPYCPWTEIPRSESHSSEVLQTVLQQLHRLMLIIVCHSYRSFDSARILHA